MKDDLSFILTFKLWESQCWCSSWLSLGTRSAEGLPWEGNVGRDRSCPQPVWAKGRLMREAGGAGCTVLVCQVHSSQVQVCLAQAASVWFSAAPLGMLPRPDLSLPSPKSLLSCSTLTFEPFLLWWRIHLGWHVTFKQLQAKGSTSKDTNSSFRWCKDRLSCVC